MRGLAYVIAAGMIAAGCPVRAQQPVPATGMVEPVSRADVAPDGTVTFRISAPLAEQASLYLPNQTPKQYPLTKGSDGTWSRTVGPLAPGIYDYAFLLGGAEVNHAYFEVKGATPAVYDPMPVPRGLVARQGYFSKVQDRERAMKIYLPAAYFREPSRRFPVLYLFAGDNEDGWTEQGRANVILDNQIAVGTAVPMIVVMPNNTTGPVPRPALENAAIMEREMMTEIVPFIDSTFRTLPDRDHRAIAGLSFGGGTAFTLGARHLDSFGTVAEFGTGAFGGAERTAYAPGYVDFDPEKIMPGLYAKLAAPATRPRLFVMTVGDRDPRAPFQRKAYEAFRVHGDDPQFKVYPGGHEWAVFRPSFVDLAPRLFK